MRMMKKIIIISKVDLGVYLKCKLSVIMRDKVST